jgi:drug/metabolite transporter (DMT)-like permease
MRFLMNYLPTIAFWFLGIIWGSNFITMKMASEWISPIQIVFYRVLFGFIPVLLYALSSRVLDWSHLRHVLHFVFMSLLATAIYYFGFAKGTSLLLSGVAGVLSGAIPLFAFLLGVIFIAEEKASAIKISGVLLGFVGVVLIARPFEQDLAATNLEGAFYVILGSLSLGASFVYARKFIVPLGIPAAALTTYQQGIGLIVVTVFTDFSGIMTVTQDIHAFSGLVIGLGLLGTGVAYLAYYYIVKSMGAIAASSVTYVPPIVALIIGAIIVRENIQWLDYLATLCILAGVMLLRERKSKTI